MPKTTVAAALTLCFVVFSSLVRAQQTMQIAASVVEARESPAVPAHAALAVVPATSTTLEVKATLQDIHTALAPVPQIEGEEILSAAGSYGDVSRYIQALPGVAWNSDLSNDVLVRNGHPEENLFVIDGVEFPGISHLALSGTTGGFTSMIDSTAVGSMEMRPGVVDASYSSRLSSLIELRTRQLGEAPEERSLSLGISGIGGLYQRSLPKSGVLLVSAHRSILNLVTNDIGINGVPIYSNLLTRLELAPGSRDSLTILSLGGIDSIKLTPCAGDWEVTSSYRTQYRGWRDTGALTWKHAFDAQVASEFSAEYSIAQQDINQQQQIGYVWSGNIKTCTPITTTPTYMESSHNGLPRVNFTVRAALRGWLLSAGADGGLMMPNDAVDQPKGQLSPFSASTTATDAVSFHRHIAAGQEAGFFQAESAMDKRWNLMAGVRAEGFALDGSYAFEPRISVVYRLSERQSLNASWNAAAQLPPTMDLLSYPANHQLRPIEVRQATAGLRLWQGRWGTLDAAAYSKQYRREPISTEFPQLMLFNMVDTLGQSFVWLPLTDSGTASSRGVEAVLRGHWRERASLMLSASRSQSEYRALDGIRRNGSYDTPMMINAVDSFRLPLGITLNGRESFASGRVYCPFDLPDSLAQMRGIYDLTRINALRGPVYNRLDAELERQFKVAKGELVIQGGAENILNRGNLLGYVWLQNCTAGLPCTNAQGLPIAKVDQMGRFPSFSARYRF
jgi:outer membrane receptor protein involved in Fe transport